MAGGDDLDHEKLAEAALALLSLTGHDGGRVWKALDWSLTDRLHANGWISDPATKAKSLWLTPAGEQKAREVLSSMFSKASGPKGRHATKSAQAQRIDTGQIENAIVMRCTAKLLKELRLKPTKPPPEVPCNRDWHASLLRIERRKCLLITHTETLYSIVLLGVRREHLNRLGQEFGARAHEQLLSDGLAAHSAVLPSPEPYVIYGKTNNRSVLGSMNDLTNQLKWAVDGAGALGNVDVPRLRKSLNRIPMCGTLDGKYAIDAMSDLLRT